MSPTTEQLRGQMADELEELGPMPDLSGAAAREGARILRRRRIAAGSLLGITSVGVCSLVGAVAAGALPGSDGRVADTPTPTPTPRPVPSTVPTVVPPVPTPTHVPSSVPTGAPVPTPPFRAASPDLEAASPESDADCGAVECAVDRADGGAAGPDPDPDESLVF